MGDIWVHVRMKACCRETLKNLDQRKRKATHKGGILSIHSLFDTLSEKTIDAAKAAIPSGEVQQEGDMEALTRAACAKICEHHSKLHEEKGETEEGELWRALMLSIEPKRPERHSQ